MILRMGPSPAKGMSKNALSTTRGRASLLATGHVMVDLEMPDPSVFLHIELTSSAGAAMVTIRRRYGLDRTELNALLRALGGGRAHGTLRGVLEKALAAPAEAQVDGASEGNAGRTAHRKARAR